MQGIGPTTKTLLLKELKSVKRIKEADLAALQKLLGPVRGEKIYRNLHPDAE